MSNNHEVLSVLFLFREYQKLVINIIGVQKKIPNTDTQIEDIADNIEKKIILLMDE